MAESLGDVVSEGEGVESGGGDHGEQGTGECEWEDCGDGVDSAAGGDPTDQNR